MKKSFFVTALVVALFSGCAQKELEYNKPAAYWYEKMTEAVGRGDLDRADDYFTSLQSEHISSILLPEAMLILAQAHMQHDEYLLSDFYFDDYLKRFGRGGLKESVEYFKIKAKFLAFKYPHRDQRLLADSIAAARYFLQSYPRSSYVPEVQTMLTRFYLGQEVVDRGVVALYNRINEPQAAKFYEDNMRRSPIVWESVVPSEQGFVRALFEGSSEKSWLDDIVPKHKIDRGVDFINDDDSWFNRLIQWSWKDGITRTKESDAPTVDMENEPKETEASWHHYLNPINWLTSSNSNGEEVKESAEPKEEKRVKPNIDSKQERQYGSHGSDEGVTIEVEEGGWLNKLNPLNWFKN